MEIQLDDKHRISSDLRNYIIQKKAVKKKTGQIYWKSEHFYRTINALLKDYREMRLRSCKDIDSFEDYINEAKAITYVLEKVIVPTKHIDTGIYASIEPIMFDK